MLVKRLEEALMEEMGNGASLLCLFGLTVLGRTVLSKGEERHVKSLCFRLSEM